MANSTEMCTQHHTCVETIVFLGHVGKECLKSPVDHEGTKAQLSKRVGQEKPEQTLQRNTSEVHTACFHAASSFAHTNSLKQSQRVVTSCPPVQNYHNSVIEEAEPQEGQAPHIT